MRKYNDDTKKNILSLDGKEVKTFLLKCESYTSISLPPYIDFEPILKKAEDIFKTKKHGVNSIDNLLCTDIRPKNCENMNYKLFHNKDGAFDWRQFELINPINLCVISFRNIRKMG